MTIHKGAYVSLEVGIKPKVILRSGYLYWQEYLYRKRGGKKDNPHLPLVATWAGKSYRDCHLGLQEAHLCSSLFIKFHCHQCWCPFLTHCGVPSLPKEIHAFLFSNSPYLLLSFLPASNCKTESTCWRLSSLAIGLNSTWFNLICQLSTIPSRTGKIKSPIGGTLRLQASISPCKIGIVSSGGCKPTGRDACVGQRKRCRKNWYYLEKNNWHHLSQFACEMVCPVMLPEECIMAHFPHYTLFFGSRTVAGCWVILETATVEKATGIKEKSFLVKWY